MAEEQRDSAWPIVVKIRLTTGERRGQTERRFVINTGGTEAMIKTSIGVQELRRRIAIKAKTDQDHRFWGLFCHIWKMDILEEAYRLCRLNRGAPGIDGQTFADIEEAGREDFLTKISSEIKEGNYKPDDLRVVRIPKRSGGFRELKIATIKDRVVQGALKLILEPVFEMDFMDGSYGYRPRRSAHQALERVRKNLGRGFYCIVDVDIKSFFDEVPHDILLSKLSKRIQDDAILKLCKVILKTAGKRGLPQGSLIGPLFSNVFLTEVDKMLEDMRVASFDGKYFGLDYVRFADDIVVMVNYGRSNLASMAMQRLGERLSKLKLRVSREKSRIIRLFKGNSFNYLGYNFALISTGIRASDCKVLCRPQRDRRTDFLRDLRAKLRTSSSTLPIERVVKDIVNPRVAGWVNYFRWGNSGKDLSFIRWRVESMVRKAASRQQPVKRGGRSWTKWRREEVYGKWGLYSNYRVLAR
jgi:RNA-directed DNA polymerase